MYYRYITEYLCNQNLTNKRHKDIIKITRYDYLFFLMNKLYFNYFNFKFYFIILFLKVISKISQTFLHGFMTKCELISIWSWQVFNKFNMQDTWKHCSAFQSTTGQRIYSKKYKSTWILGERRYLFAGRSKWMYFSPKYLCTSYVLLYEWCISGKKHICRISYNELTMNITDMTRVILIRIPILFSSVFLMRKNMAIFIFLYV